MMKQREKEMSGGLAELRLRLTLALASITYQLRSE